MATSRTTKTASARSRSTGSGSTTARSSVKSAAKPSTGSSGLRKGIRITGTDRDSLTAKITRRYLAGESIRSMAADLGRSYGFVHRILVDAAVPLRGRGGATRTKKK
jgi:hypothetical protein